MYRITIKEGKDKAPRRHHPWIFSGAIEKTEPPFTEADWAEVVSEAGMFIAYGWYDEESHITLRLMSWKKNEKLNDDFIRRLVRESVSRRRDFFSLPDTTAFRLIHGEADFLPGIACDAYGREIRLIISSRFADKFLPVIASELSSMLKPSVIEAVTDKQFAGLEGLKERIRHFRDGVETKEDEKKVVDFDSFDTFDFMTDVSQKKDIYDVAENIVKNVDKDGDIEIINNADKEDQTKTENNEASEEKSDVAMENFTLDESTFTQEETSPTGVEEKPKKKAGRPRKVVKETSAPKRGRGRPKKTAEPVVEKKKPGRPRKILTQTTTAPKKKVGRPKKIVKEVESAPEIKRGRGRPRKQINSILEINKRLSEEEEKLQNMRKSLNAELEEAMHEMNAQNVDDKQAKREELLKEIDSLQAEAQEVINKNQPESKITEINAKLETLLEEIKKLNS